MDTLALTDRVVRTEGILNGLQSVESLIGSGGLTIVKTKPVVSGQVMPALPGITAPASSFRKATDAEITLGHRIDSQQQAQSCDSVEGLLRKIALCSKDNACAIFSGEDMAALHEYLQQQMSPKALRDEIAIEAMKEIIAKAPHGSHQIDEYVEVYDAVAAGAYSYADAMLKARESSNV